MVGKPGAKLTVKGKSGTASKLTLANFTPNGMAFDLNATPNADVEVIGDGTDLEILYHLSALVDSGRAPREMVDRNIKTDYDKLQTIADIQHAQYRGRNGGSAEGDAGEDVLPLIEELAATGKISFDLVESFPAEAIAEDENFPRRKFPSSNRRSPSTA